MRCCYHSSLAAAASAFLLASSSSSVAAERVLVLGAQKDLVHDAITQDASQLKAFTPVGLAGLAMDAYGLATGNLVHLSSDRDTSMEQVLVQSPVQADVFTHVDAYAMVFLDKSDAAVLEKLNAATTAGYHKVFDLQESSTGVSSAKIPTVLARELAKATGGADIRCAGSAAVCGGSDLETASVSEDLLNRVFKSYSFLDRTVEVDVAFAEQLAQTQQLTLAITTDKATALYVVSFSSVNALGEGKRQAARDAVAAETTQLLAALQKVYPSTSGAQVVAASHSTVRALDSSVLAYSRMLTTFKEVIGSDDEDEDDESGSGDTSGNATVSDVTMETIAEYQIVLWTSVMLGFVLFLVILAMCNMEPKRDSLLYAKFTTSSGGHKYD